MLFCVRHLNMVVQQFDIHQTLKSEASVSVTASLSLLHPHNRNAVQLFNFKSLSLSTQQKDASSPSPLLPLHTRSLSPIYNKTKTTRLIELYLNRGKFELARHVFEESLDRDVSVWGAMINGLARNGLPSEALEYVRLMIEEGINPNSDLMTVTTVTEVMTVILHAIGEVRARRLGKEAHAVVVKTNSCYENLLIQSALFDMYCKCGDIGSGSRVLYSLMLRNGGCWTGVISGGRLEIAMRSKIRLKRFRPGVVTVASVLPVCARLRALKQGKEIHAYALRHWFLPHVSIVSSLMVLYSKCGVIEYSVRLFDGMEQRKRNVILWTAMVDSYVENELMGEALGVMRLMQLTEHRPDTVTMARMLRVCGELKLVKLGKEVHGQVLKRDFASVHYVAAELIDMYGTCGVVDKAKLAFNVVPVKGSMTWTALIRAYGYKEWYQGAIELFDQMISSDFSPNQFTFEAVLSICDRAGFVEDAFRIFNLMSRYKIKASKEHCTIMIRLLTRYGKLDEAQRFVEMSFSL
ncbi:pentatricopeptide repeat-containing protein At1g71460, chloroplastic-like [Gastrolobium bilobum]|uniref:pentatricopeptide repeat-containing protein At1g71460, chloroplastic-like n=1 Tax=Gastrolobium bilobum TaxID=150636 RepID=UPI002AAF0DC7|nr:pentatricopeptide repeat-containing protein At1g71460, chloroplastic-like [Gastrolobium bilobum]